MLKLTRMGEGEGLGLELVVVAAAAGDEEGLDRLVLLVFRKAGCRQKDGQARQNPVQWSLHAPRYVPWVAGLSRKAAISVAVAQGGKKAEAEVSSHDGEKRGGSTAPFDRERGGGAKNPGRRHV
jgi:hypothetical protein